MLRALLISTVICLPMKGWAETLLLMAQEDGCYWCGRWDAEIAHIYPKIAEGRTASLKRFDLRGSQPDYQFSKPVTFTPTFLLIDNGREVGRIEGYPGEDFFWGLLNEMFTRADIPLDQGS